jgi:LacI family transcriptional regulator
VVGFDNIPFSSYFDPPLGTVEIPKYPVGAAAMEMLVNLISKKDAERFRWFIPQLLIRDSTVKRGMLKDKKEVLTNSLYC